jgi:hypothetical protein
LRCFLGLAWVGLAVQAQLSPLSAGFWKTLAGNCQWPDGSAAWLQAKLKIADHRISASAQKGLYSNNAKSC